jgi:hypothetical protein
VYIVGGSTGKSHTFRPFSSKLGWKRWCRRGCGSGQLPDPYSLRQNSANDPHRVERFELTGHELPSQHAYQGELPAQNATHQPWKPRLAHDDADQVFELRARQAVQLGCFPQRLQKRLARLLCHWPIVRGRYGTQRLRTGTLRWRRESGG